MPSLKTTPMTNCSLFHSYSSELIHSIFYSTSYYLHRPLTFMLPTFLASTVSSNWALFYKYLCISVQHEALSPSVYSAIRSPHFRILIVTSFFLWDLRHIHELLVTAQTCCKLFILAWRGPPVHGEVWDLIISISINIPIFAMLSYLFCFICGQI